MDILDGDHISHIIIVSVLPTYISLLLLLSDPTGFNSFVYLREVKPGGKYLSEGVAENYDSGHLDLLVTPATSLICPICCQLGYY